MESLKHKTSHSVINTSKTISNLLFRRISDEIYSMIPLSQAPYRKGRSAAEHVFAMKILCEKAITSCDYSTHILLLDMTKAFGTINREHLCRLLSDILDPDELSTMNILLKDVILQVKNKRINFYNNLRNSTRRLSQCNPFYTVPFKYIISKNTNSYI